MRVLIAVPYRSGGCDWRTRSKATVTAWWRTALPEFPLVEVDDGGDPFSRGGSLNQAMETHQPDVLVAADADMLIGRQQILDAVQAASEAPGMVQPFDRLDWYGPVETCRLHQDPHLFWPRSLPATYSWPVDDQTPLLGGVNVLSRETWEAAGGWLPAFRGWGHEDVAMAVQCRTLAGPHRRLHGHTAHLYHPVRQGKGYDRGEANAPFSAQVLAAAGDPEAMRQVVQELGGRLCVS